MDLNLHEPPREFTPLAGIKLKDMGDITLKTDEQVTFLSESGKANDVVRKEWGYYLCNSINCNLKRQNFKMALVQSNASNPPRIYLNLVEKEKLDVFEKYVKEFQATVICWLDEWMEIKEEN